MIWMTVAVCSQRIVHNYSDETQQLANGHHKTALCNLLQKKRLYEISVFLKLQSQKLERNL